MSVVLAQRGKQLLVGDPASEYGRIWNRGTGYGPPMNVQSVLARGYWHDPPPEVHAPEGFEPPPPPIEASVRARLAEFDESKVTRDRGRFAPHGSGSDAAEKPAEKTPAEKFAESLNRQVAGEEPWDQGFMPPFRPGFEQRVGRCYELAGSRVVQGMLDPDSQVAAVVHGTIQGPGSPPIDHAWTVNKDGSIHEPGSDLDFTPKAYGELFNAEERVRYSPEEAARLMVDQEHYGPWDK